MRSHVVSVLVTLGVFVAKRAGAVLKQAPPIAKWAFAFAVVTCAISLAAAAAEAANPEIKRLSPPGAQRGAEHELKLDGSRLGDAQEIIFYDSGLSVASLAAEGERVKVRLVVAPDCRLGMHALRVRTASGISNLRMFSVGPLPETAEAEPNDDFFKPQKISLDTTISGVVKDEDVDYYAIEAKKGERISAEIEGLRLGYTLFDPYVAILNTARFELTHSDDTPLLKQDGLVSLIVPEDGTYIIQVRDSSYDGSNNAVYRLHVGRFPRPTAVLPSGGRMGESISVRWLGDVLGERDETIALPAAPQDHFAIVPHDEHGVAPSGLPFRLVDFGNVMEVEPNNTVDVATSSDSAPIAFNGVISCLGDVDYFKFHATKGQHFDVQVYARVHGSPIDSVIDIFHVGGKRIGGNDDSGDPDSYMSFKIPEDGDYAISIRDHLGQGGADYAYRIEVTPEAPSVRMGLPDRARYVETTIAVPRDNRTAVMVSAKRSDFRGDLRLELKDLPPGVSVETIPMSSDRSEVPMLFQAADGAALATSMADLIGKGSDSENPSLSSRFSQRTMLIRGRNNTEMLGFTGRRMPVTVTQATPFRIDLVEPKVPLVQGGALNLKVVATRQPGFNAEIKLQTLYKPPGMGSSAVSIAEGQTEALVPLTASAEAGLDKWPMAIVGEATVGDGPVWVSTQLASVEVAGPFVAFATHAVSVEQGKKVELGIKIEKKRDFEGAAKVELLGLPGEATAEAAEITADTTDLVFKINTTANSPVGRHKNLVCRATVMVGGEPVLHMLPAGELRIDAPLQAKKKANPKDKGKASSESAAATVVSTAPAAPAVPPKP